MLVVGIIGILALAIPTISQGYFDRARVAWIFTFTRDMRLKWEMIMQYNYETINTDGSIPNVWPDAFTGTFNLQKMGTRFWEPATSVTGSLSLIGLGQAGSYQTSSYTATPQIVPLSGYNFIVMHWIRTLWFTGQTYTVLNTWDGDGFRFWISGWQVAILIWNSGWYYEGSCGSAKNISDGRWHHIAAYFQMKESKVSCYYDGKFLSSVAVSPAFLNFTNKTIYIGNGLQSAFSGELDDVAIIRESWYN